MTNDAIARRLREHAAELARGGDNLYRVRAFRQAAFVVQGWPEPLEQLDRKRLESLPGIGRSLATLIAGYVKAN